MKLLFAMLLLIEVSCTHAPAASCDGDPILQKARSAQMAALVHEDQMDRDLPFDAIDWNRVNPRDLGRRIQVAKIFAEGCFHTAADYAAAALIFQHGTTADHYYQVFVWANQAFKLGDETQRWMAGSGLDRYLVKIGHKQLFGTQLSKNADGKFCVQPVEPSFPEARRVLTLKMTLPESNAFVLKAIGSKQDPSTVEECQPALQPTPSGTVPGFW